MTKTLLLAIIGLLAVFYSCQKEDTSIEAPITKSAVLNHFYGVAMPEQEPETKAVAQRGKLWENGTTIIIDFINDPYGAKEKIQAYAKEWEKYANVSFFFKEKGDVYRKADVRIAFDMNKDVTWSYTGTDCKLLTDINKPTINFAKWSNLTQQEQKGDVLRAFGQVLGLELEYRHLAFDPGWKSESSIEEHWEGDISDIPWNELKEYVFTPLETFSVEQTKDYDAKSIMVWPFPDKYTTNLNNAQDYNYQLSQNDIDFISEIYPRILQLIMRFNYIYLKSDDWQQGLELYFSTTNRNSNTIPVIDYGDEINISTPNKGSGYCYPETGIYAVKIYGDPLEFDELGINGEYSDDGFVTDLWVSSECNNLTNLDLGNVFNTQKLDLGELDKLTDISISNIDELDLLAKNIDKLGWSSKDIYNFLYTPIEFNLNGLISLENMSLGGIWIPSFLNLQNCNKLGKIEYYIEPNYGYPLNTMTTRSAQTSNTIEYDKILNIVNNLPAKSGKLKIKDENATNMLEIKNIANSKGWTIEN